MREMEHSVKQPVWLTCLILLLCYYVLCFLSPKAWGSVWSFLATWMSCANTLVHLALPFGVTLWSWQWRPGQMLLMPYWKLPVHFGECTLWCLDLNLKDFKQVAVCCCRMRWLKLRTSMWFAQHAVVVASRCLKPPDQSDGHFQALPRNRNPLCLDLMWCHMT